MTFKKIATALLTAGWILPVFGEDLTPKTTAAITVSTGAAMNATTIDASTVISPGRYMASIAPNINNDMAARIEKAMGKVPGIDKVRIHGDDYSVHFTVNNGATVRIVDIQQAIANADSEAVISTPILEHSLTANPGL